MNYTVFLFEFSITLMPSPLIPYSQTGYFSKLICDYLSETTDLKRFYNRFPSLDNFKSQIEEKQKTFSSEQRHILSKRIMYQYGYNKLSQATLSNIDLLREPSTFTITTGHQLNLFTGPLYFLYKIFSTINLAEELSEKYPQHHFVPIYWMATEDHDFEEINFFNFKGKKIQWDRESGGAVGEMSLEGLKSIKEVLKKELGESENAHKLLSHFKKAYLKHDNLADATHYLANCLFSDYGLVIIDGNDKELKKAFIPYAEKELTENLSFNNITETTEYLTSLGYPQQVQPREINLFYLKENLRERIIEKDDRFYINETDISFSKEEILKELKDFPERFSPNALLRPLYEEIILPNLCYIGGGGELAYWFQLKDYFKAVDVVFPILLLRNSVLLIPDNLIPKINKHKLSVQDLFLSQHDLITKRTYKVSSIDIDFSKQRAHLKKQFKNLYKIAEKTDASFLGAVGAQEKKQINGLDNLEKRLLKAQKRKFSKELDQVKDLQNELFPNNSLQEREANFAEFYLEYGEELLNRLKDELDPLDFTFRVIALKENEEKNKNT